MASSKGTIYLIRHERTGLYKIGMTSRWGQRSKALEVGKTTRLIKKIECQNHQKWERVLHKMFAEGRLAGSEYFELDAGEAIRKLEWVSATANETHQMVIGKWKNGANGLYRRRKSKNGYWYTQKPSQYEKDYYLNSRVEAAEALVAQPDAFEQAYAPERFKTVYVWNPAGFVWLGIGVALMPYVVGFPIAFFSLFALRKSKTVRI